MPIPPRRRAPRTILAILAFPTILAAACAAPRPEKAASPAARLAAPIHRDAWGVPHVFSASDEGVLSGMAWALAEDDWPLIEANYVQAPGRAAEVEANAVGTYAVPGQAGG